MKQHKDKTGRILVDLFFSNPNNEIQKHIDDFNIKYIQKLSIVFAIIQFGYFILTFTSYFDVPERTTYRMLYAINALVCLFFYLSSAFFYFKNNKKAAWVEQIQALIIISVIACTILLSNLDFRYGGDCIVYCAVILAITTLTLQSPFQALLFHFISGFMYLFFWNMYIGAFDFGYNIQFTAFILLCYSSGVVKYKFFVERTRSQIELTNISEEFRQSSLKDTLTGVNNRRALIQNSYIFCEENCFFLFTDIDFFKKVNDTYGHQNGDFVINYYAKQLCEIFGKQYVYRFGGDEFMVVVPSMRKKDSEKSLELLQKALSDVVFDNESHSFSVSGGYLFAELGCSNLTIKVEDLLRKLDRALYEVKNNGRGYFLQA